MMIGAHPDDCEFRTGGTVVKLKRQGHTVMYVSATNGNAGHHEKSGDELVKIRAGEVKNSARVAGLEFMILDNDDACLVPDIDTRIQFIRLFREFKPDFIFTHRTNDYHPDHRNTGILVQDSIFTAGVPNVCPDTPVLDKMPVILYTYDRFKKPMDFMPDLVVSIDDVMDKKVQMLDCHKSQVYEWLPWSDGILDKVPREQNERYEWLFDRLVKRDEKVADHCRQKLIERYGRETGEHIKCAEAFEISEYGRQMAPEELDSIFPR
jgi:LmbE family N-acetylglucosaminyl deacetylase